MEKQVLESYQKLKKKHPDAIILFRKGDFYYSYKSDAAVCSETLGLTLTIDEDGTQVLSFPHYSLDVCLPRLVRAGHRIAICDFPVEYKVVKRNTGEYVKTIKL